MLHIRKKSGKLVPYNENKIKHSLQRAGASSSIINTVLTAVHKELYEGISTEKLHKIVFHKFKSLNKHQSGKYNLKKALLGIGPSGYPFEIFVSELLKAQGFKTQVSQIIPGHCVNHEVDVVAEHKGSHYLVECKFHLEENGKCDVKTPLYIYSRFEDIKKNASVFNEGWLVTNTRFTTDALQYGTCMGLHMISWDYPEKGSLRDMINQTGQHPITCLNSLTTREKSFLLQNKIATCHQLLDNAKLLLELGLTEIDIEKIFQETRAIIST